MTYTTVIIDDSSTQRLVTSKLVSSHPDLKLIGSFANPYEAIKSIYENKVDIVFMDIQMDTVDAFELLDSIEIQPTIILNSTQSRFAITAFDYGISYYLMKPMCKSKFHATVNKAIKQIKRKSTKTFYYMESISNFSVPT
ncbi:MULTISPECIES: LytR/AlgR family response regulator transcription factor [Flavobacteriaceae]|uniref:LytR/AlgR family response regulator transcription factor n=1 Tax=Flavobacteriaceae TaxID=49546 RepID=UPI001491F51C|nr:MULTISPECIES: response regulator [Allomuricauda]MDC6366052.1 response regulator [Muricauda sp. AC10]